DRAHTEPLRVLTVDLHQLGPLGAELDAVDAVLVRPLDPRVRLLGGLRTAFAPAAARTLIVPDARRDDLVAGAALFLFHGDGVVVQGDAAHRGQAVREPQLVWIFGVGIFRRAAGVHVQIDEAGHHVHAGRVDLVIGFRRPIRAERQPGRPRIPDRRDPV